MRSILIGGLLPVIIYTVVEEYGGILWGLICGMIFGIGEILFEWRKYGKVEAMTWIGNGMLIGLGGISLFTGTGIWFKLQPAIIEAVMAGVLLVSVFMGKPLLAVMAKKQGLPVPENIFRGVTIRIAIFFLLHAVLASYAALYWSTRAWAFLKGVGFTVSFLLYMVGEGFFLRSRIRQALMPVMQPGPNGGNSNPSPPGRD